MYAQRFLATRIDNNRATLLFVSFFVMEVLGPNGVRIVHTPRLGGFQNSINHRLRSVRSVHPNRTSWSIVNSSLGTPMISQLTCNLQDVCCVGVHLKRFEFVTDVVFSSAGSRVLETSITYGTGWEMYCTDEGDCICQFW